MGKVLFCLLVLFTSPSLARDNDQWATDSDISKWYQQLMRPDYPTASCCGEADAYHADSFERSSDGKNYIAIITDERPDAPLKRPHIDVGTRILVPDGKLKYDAGNPTGHGVIFISGANVYCYVVPGGI